MMDKEVLIEKFFLGTLNEEEQIIFVKLKETDSDFREELAFQTCVQKSILSEKYEPIRRRLEKLEEAYNLKESKLYIPWVAAASVILFIVAIFMLNQKHVPKELYTEYYRTAPNISHPIVRSNELKTMKNEAFIAYEKGEFNEAYNFFDSLISSTKDTSLLFYQGICLLELGKTEEAVEKLESHRAFSDALSERSRWYLALSYLRTENVIKTRELLNEIIQRPSHYKYQESIKLLNEID